MFYLGSFKLIFISDILNRIIFAQLIPSGVQDTILTFPNVQFRQKICFCVPLNYFVHEIIQLCGIILKKFTSTSKLSNTHILTLVLNVIYSKQQNYQANCFQSTHKCSRIHYAVHSSGVYTSLGTKTVRQHQGF
jgi:hypothetical protein